jgi:hypothetical protein
VTTAATKPAEAAGRGGIRFTDRVIIFGTSGSGKSELANHIATGPRCQRLLYDTKDEFTIPGVQPVYKPRDIRWDEPVIHLIDDSCELDDVGRLFQLCWDRKVGRTGHAYGLVVIVHELGDLCLDTPQKTPRPVINYLKKGRAHGLGLIGASQRPRNIPVSARTEVQHVFTFGGGLDPDDLPIAAKMHRLSVPEFETALEQARALGEHAYIWRDIRAGRNMIRPNLPEHLRARSLATGIDARQYNHTNRSEETTVGQD